MKKIELLLFYLSYYDKSLVVFEGGLGSQILSYFELLSLEESGIRPRVNLDYFLNQSNGQSNTTTTGSGDGKRVCAVEGGSINRPWALDLYGIKLSEISKLEMTSLKRKIPTNFIKKVKPKYYEQFLKMNLKETFKVQDIKLNNFLTSKGVGSEYYAVHLRRGDYLEVASRIVSDEEVFEILSRILPNFKTAPVLIISDSQIDSGLVNKVRRINNQSVISVDPTEADMYLSHDLLRNARVLITSNSTFSLSAALLARDDQLAFLPTQFYSGYRESILNDLINRLSKFSMLSK